MSIRAIPARLSPLHQLQAAIWSSKMAQEVSTPSTSGTSTPREPNAEAGPSTRVADKWVKSNGPPVGSTFGARLLKEEDDVWNHNAWDHVELPEDFHARAAEIIERHRSSPVSAQLRDDYNDRPAHYWDQFYSKHKEMFFKDRGWLRLEFPELIACSEADAGPKLVLEVGCGAGNTVFPVLLHNENPELVVYATDYSKEAVEVVKSNPMYPVPMHGKGKMKAAVWDITSAGDAGTLPEGIEPGSVDVITVIYVLSALHPGEWNQAIHNLYTALKPGGLLLVRDYGRHDLAPLRIKKDRMLDVDNLYIRGDGTRVYFFTKEELEGLVSRPHGDLRIEEGRSRSLRTFNGEGDGQDMFEVFMCGVDRRLIVNRKEKKQMYRIWMQMKARKLS